MDLTVVRGAHLPHVCKSKLLGASHLGLLGVFAHLIFNLTDFHLNKMSDKLEVYTKSTKAWFKDPEEGYVVASLVEKIVDDKNCVLKFKADANNAVRCSHAQFINLMNWYRM